MDVDKIITLSTLLLAVAALQSSAEDLFCCWMYPVGLFVRPPRTGRLREPLAMSFVLARGIAGAVLVWQLTGPFKTVALTSAAVVSLAVTSIVLRRLLPGSVDAAIQAIIGSQVAILWLAPEVIQPLVLLLVAFTVSLSYCLSGVGKCRYWRDASELSAMLRLPYIQNVSVARFMDDHPRYGGCALWGVKLWETMFPVCIVGGPTICGVFLSVGALFHLFNAAVMGFTRAPLTMFVSYPAVYYCSYLIRDIR
jgi:hypothetical protein